MNIKELAIRGLLQKHGKSHLYETCPELIDELVQLGEELAPRWKTLKAGNEEIRTSPYIPNDYWNMRIGDFKEGQPLWYDMGDSIVPEDIQK